MVGWCEVTRARQGVYQLLTAGPAWSRRALADNVIHAGQGHCQTVRDLDPAGAENLVRPGSGGLEQHCGILFLSTCLGLVKSLKVTR
jgi:hypothetical protein